MSLFGLLRRFLFLPRRTSSGASLVVPFALASAHWFGSFYQLLTMLTLVGLFYPRAFAWPDPLPGIPFPCPQSFAWLNLMRL